MRTHCFIVLLLFASSVLSIAADPAASDVENAVTLPRRPQPLFHGSNIGQVIFKNNGGLAKNEWGQRLDDDQLAELEEAYRDYEQNLSRSRKRQHDAEDRLPEDQRAVIESRTRWLTDVKDPMVAALCDTVANVVGVEMTQDLHRRVKEERIWIYGVDALVQSDDYPEMIDVWKHCEDKLALRRAIYRWRQDNLERKNALSESLPSLFADRSFGETLKTAIAK